jgi:hypothetical protein
MGGGRRTVTYVEQLLVYEALLLQILEESIKSSIIADKITLKLCELCLYFHKHLELGSVSDFTSHKHLERGRVQDVCDFLSSDVLHFILDNRLMSREKGVLRNFTHSKLFKLIRFETGSNAQSDPPASVFVLLYQ